MRHAILYSLPVIASLGTAYAQSADVSTVCEEIAAAISSASEVFYPADWGYIATNFHWLSSSTQQSYCSVEPGTVEDLGAVLRTLSENDVQFGVRGGGHTANPGFSSTPGVQIALNRFGGVTYDDSTGLVSIGAGNVWDNVYKALEPYSVNVVGGRVSGVGIAGFILGGGYSFKTNQHGLTVDTVRGFDLVLPNGTATNVTESTNPDLFWALKGGFNNFGVVTTFHLQAYPQTEVWGGAILIAGYPDEVVVATQNFYDNVTDPKASLLTTINNEIGIPVTEFTLFYDGPTPPDGMFDKFLEIPAFYTDVSTRSFVSLILSTPDNATQTERGLFHTVSLYNLTVPVLNAIVNETEYWAQKLALEVPGLFVSYDVEPFLPTYFSHGSDTAWPPSRDVSLLPLNIYYSWWSADSDARVNEVMVQSADYLTQFVVSQGQPVADLTLYPNYAIRNATVERLYQGNLPRLQSIKTQYDPNNVMARAGGWKF
ncbi:hypothetical protein FOMPIDRAFT_83615 [Fomitopsis schrenkii]|uniref:FAD-binding PCMH-type domain-containing protein n=1 Tax=Fomitopsis schrenkii TaxID=2126942 RepID=S8E0Q3_FOMSC|nr:hypothetical protein FOMPIDRAFT_83615 [Fomitopsis schrenkii]